MSVAFSMCSWQVSGVIQTRLYIYYMYVTTLILRNYITRVSGIRRYSISNPPYYTPPIPVKLRSRGWSEGREAKQMEDVFLLWRIFLSNCTPGGYLIHSRIDQTSCICHAFPHLCWVNINSFTVTFAQTLLHVFCLSKRKMVISLEIDL